MSHVRLGRVFFCGLNFPMSVEFSLMLYLVVTEIIERKKSFEVVKSCQVNQKAAVSIF